MSTEKTNNSLKDRVKITKNGKVKSRKSGGNHFNAKERRRKQLKRHGTKHNPHIKKKNVEKLLPHS